MRGRERQAGPASPREIQDRYVDTLGAIANRAPDARIIAVGYPALFSPTPVAAGTGSRWQRGTSRSCGTPSTSSTLRPPREADVDYVDVAAASEGHDICSDDPWINGDQDQAQDGGAAYHPMPAEQAAVAELILDLL